MDYTQFQADLDAARTALLAGDLTTARKYSRAARICLAALGRTAQGDRSLDFSASSAALDAVDAAIAVDLAASSHTVSGPFVQVPVTYQRPDSLEGYQ